MLRLIFVTNILLAQFAYKQHLVSDCIAILKSKRECYYSEYNRLYYNISILSMMDSSFDRYEAVMALRNRCNGKLSEWEKPRK